MRVVFNSLLVCAVASAFAAGWMTSASYNKKTILEQCKNIDVTVEFKEAKIFAEKAEYTLTCGDEKIVGQATISHRFPKKKGDL